MTVKVLSILPPRKTGVLAHVAVEIQLEEQRIVLSDLRVLQNRTSQLWVGMPSIAVQDGGKSYHYEPVVELGRELKRVVEDAVLVAYEAQRLAVES